MSGQEIITIFENLSDKLDNISAVIGFAEIVQNIDENSKYFYDWIKSIEKKCFFNWFR
jgi:hypothetical protein